MTIEERILNLPNLQYKISVFDNAALQELSELYSLIFRKILKINCGNCRIRAYQELTSLDLTTIKIMENRKFKLKKDSLLYSGIDGKHYTAETITDEKSAEILKAAPSLLAHFENYPKDEHGDLLFPEPESQLEPEPDVDTESDAQPLSLTDIEKGLVYKKDGKYFLNVADAEPKKLTQKFLKEQGVDLDIVPEAK